MERYPAGLGKQSFWQKDVSRGFPAWLERVEVPKKESASKGFHLAVPLDGKAHVNDVTAFADAAAVLFVERDRTHLTREFHKADRGRRILVDTGRNGYSATFAAAYTVRAKPGAPVSAPCTWDEVAQGAAGPRTFTLRPMAARIAEVGDLWADTRRRRRSLRRPMDRVRRMLDEHRRARG